MLRDVEFDLYEVNANDFEEQCNLPDTPIEYFEQFLSYSDAGTGIRVPECFESEKIEELDPAAYAEKYQVTLACAKSIQRLREKTSLKIGDYLQLQVGGFDVWSSKKCLNFIEDLEQKNELIATVNKYIEENAERRICIRWYLRGLPLRDAIRKVLADREARKNNYAPSDRREEL